VFGSIPRLEYLEDRTAPSATSALPAPGDPNQAWLAQAYQAEVGVAINTAHANLYSQQLSQGASRTFVAAEIAATPAAQLHAAMMLSVAELIAGSNSATPIADALTVDFVCQQCLHQPATAMQMVLGVEALSAGLPPALLTALVVSSPQFYTNATPPTQAGTPHLTAASDSGISSSDGITNVNTPTVQVSALPGAPVALLLNGTVIQKQTADASGTATFHLSTLADGTYTLTAAGIGGNGQLGTPSAGSTLVIDTKAPTTPQFDLSAASGSNHTTSASQVLLVGHTDPGTQLTLVGTGITAKGLAAGTFQLANVPLALADNTLTVQAEDVAGNVSTFTQTITSTPGTGQPDAVLVWNQAALNAIRQDGTDPPAASRGLAIQQLAELDALNATDGTPGYYVTLTATAGTSPDAAVDEAAYTVLSSLHPSQQATLNALLASQLALVPDGQSKTDGITLGQAAANSILALRADDGSTAVVNYQPQSGPGYWQPTPPGYLPPLKPQWANLVPFAMTSSSEFLPPGPPPLTSQAWANAFNETESVGSINSTTRTADQTQVAYFWADGKGTETPPGHWNTIAAGAALAQNNSLDTNALLFAELDVAEADAGIAAWNAKYTYDSVRPVTVIPNAAATGNPNVQADPNWQPLLVTPNFPEYISGHSTFSAAAATVLDAFFGSNYAFTTTSDALPSVTRSFSSFDQAAVEAGQSRIYGGIHFQFSNQDGQTTGKAVGNNTLAVFNSREGL
jgi:hypothetical protein